jgi:hypothetical protein
MSRDALIEGVSGAIGAITALVSTYPLLTVSCHAWLGIGGCWPGWTHAVLWPVTRQ